MNLAGRQLEGHHAAAAPVLYDQVEHVELVEEGGTFLNVLLVQGLQNHMPGAVLGVTAALDCRFTELAGVAAELALGDLTFRGARKRQAHVLQLVHGVDHVFGEHLGGVLVSQVVTALDGVEHVPFPVVLADVAQSCAHPTLRRAGV